MFTGLVEEVGQVISLKDQGGKKRLSVRAKKAPKALKKGDSIAVSGVCLTAVEIKPGRIGFDLAHETVERTAFSRIKEGALVNLELPMKADGRFGGHMVQGHVDGTGKFLGLDPIAGAQDFWLRIQVPHELEKYLVFKGSIAIEGISLTIAKLEGDTVTVAIIPHTVAMTNLKSLKPGDPVNIETDIVAKYLEKWMSRGEQRSPLTQEALTAKGF